MSHIGTYRIGASMAIALDLMSGDTSDVTEAIAALRRVKKNERTGKTDFVMSDQAVPMAVSPRQASGDIPAGWNLTLTDEQTSLLAPGYYGVDAKLTVGSTSTITETSAIVEFTRGAVT